LGDWESGFQHGRGVMIDGQSGEKREGKWEKGNMMA